MTATTVNYRSFVIANPTAAAGEVKEEWPLIERLLRANLPELDYAFTEGPGHATILAREALRAGWEMVICVGGDGTLNEVVNGFYENTPSEQTFALDDEGFIEVVGDKPSPVSEEAVLGVLPMGTGGDFRRSLGLMGGLAETVEHFRGRHTRRVDVGHLGFLDHDDQIGSRHFINIACAGMGGMVDYYVNRGWKGLGGTASFALGTVRAFLKYRNTQMVVRLDDTQEMRDYFTNVVCANGRYFGGGMWVAPGAELDDGSFQVVLLGNLSKREMLKTLPKLYSGTHLSLKKINRHRASEVSVRTLDRDQEVLLDVDGEQPGKLPALWHLYEKGIQIKM